VVKVDLIKQYVNVQVTLSVDEAIKLHETLGAANTSYQVWDVLDGELKAAGLI
jgi:hypothetical protein